MSTSVSITTLKLNVGGKDIELTAEEARGVYVQLSLLFAQTKENPLTLPYPGSVPPSPIDWFPQPWQVPYRVVVENLSTLSISQ